MKRIVAAFATASLIALSAQAESQMENGQSPSALNPVATPPPKDFGAGVLFYSAIDSFALAPYSAGFTVGRSPLTHALFCAGGSTESRAVGQVILPHGVDLEVFRIWGFDNGAQDLTATFQSSCLPDVTAAMPINTSLGSAGSSGTGGAFAAGATVLGNINVDNQSCTYQVIVQFGDNTNACGASLFFYKARIHWRRLIPPAPAVATFNDVPLNAQFFREVEALVNAGITQGCTLTEFCPETFVTRRQMAAFLARALGLPREINDPANP